MTQFNTMMQQARADLEAVNYTALRFAYTETDLYTPYGQQKYTERLNNALQSGEVSMAYEIAHNILQRINPVDIATNLKMAFICNRLNKPDESWYMQFGLRLLKSITEVSNGYTPETAFHVISLDEEYEVLKVLRVRPQKQALVQHDGHYYDVFDIAPSDGQQPDDTRTLDAHIHQLYFNIDRPYAMLSQRMQTTNQDTKTQDEND